VFSKNGGNLGEQGSVAWMFERKGQILIESDKAKEDDLMNVVLEAGGEDLRNDGEQWEILTAPEAMVAIQEAVQKAGIPVASATVAMIPKNTIRVDGKNAAAILRLTEALEEHDDVQNVFSNFDIDEKEMEALA
jgi:transcriptional/translational regulatory protein YebC/TACO1